MNLSPKACLVCFSFNIKLYSLNSGTLRRDFELISGLHSYEEVPLEYLCFECMAKVRNFIKFRDKCQRALNCLLQLSETNELSTTRLLLINRKEMGILPDLSYLNYDKTYYEKVSHSKNHHNKGEYLNTNSISIVHYSITDDQDDDDRSEWDVSITKPVVKAELEESCPSNTKIIQEDSMFIHEDDEFQIDNDDNVIPDDREEQENNERSKTEEEYAYVYPISLKEAQAASKVSILYQKTGGFNCAICKKSFNTIKILNDHLRMHDVHISGTYNCKICNYYYKTELLLQSHMKDKHMYKYVCKQCPEVNFDRRIAKQHFVLSHLNKRVTMGPDWYEVRPTWLKKKTFTESKPTSTEQVTKPLTKKSGTKRVKRGVADDYLLCKSISQEEQYRMVHDRMRSQNYIRSLFKCELCFRGFKEKRTYDRHMQKHDPTISGPYECDMCKLRFKNTRQIYCHVKRSHLYKYTCRSCDFVCVNNCQAMTHYRWHQNVTYPCSMCGKEFKKQSSRLTHIRIHHPSIWICRLCGHSFVTENGLNCHIKISHKTEESTLRSTKVDKTSQYYCSECNVHFLNHAAFVTHLGSSNKHVTTNISSKSDRTVKEGARKRRPYGQPSILNNGIATPTNCDVCGKYIPNDVQARKHYESEHPGTEFPKRYMCDVCGHTTSNYHNLMHHMRSHTQEKPYKCPHCDKMFSQPGNMKRHLDVHTGEKRFPCEHCNKRFAQKITMKLHVQTVHFKIPYPLWNKKNRKRRNEAKSMGNTVSEVPTSSVTSQRVPTETQGDYFNAYVNSFNDFVA